MWEVPSLQQQPRLGSIILTGIGSQGPSWGNELLFLGPGFGGRLFFFGSPGHYFEGFSPGTRFPQGGLMQAPGTGSFSLRHQLGGWGLGVEIGIGRLPLLALVLDGQDLLALQRLAGHQGTLSPTGGDYAGGSKIFILGRESDDGDQDDDPQTDAGTANQSQASFPPIPSGRPELLAVMPGPGPEKGIKQICAENKAQSR